MISRYFLRFMRVRYFRGSLSSGVSAGCFRAASFELESLVLDFLFSAIFFTSVHSIVSLLERMDFFPFCSDCLKSAAEPEACLSEMLKT